MAIRLSVPTSRPTRLVEPDEDLLDGLSLLRGVGRPLFIRFAMVVRSAAVKHQREAAAGTRSRSRPSSASALGGVASPPRNRLLDGRRKLDGGAPEPRPASNPKRPLLQRTTRWRTTHARPFRFQRIVGLLRSRLGIVHVARRRSKHRASHPCDRRRTRRLRSRLADRLAGVPVVLHEMRPVRSTDAHKTDGLAELVCSNSFRSDDRETNAVGLLHEEMRRLDSLVMRAADANQVPAGGALAVDRDGFSAAITQALDRASADRDRARGDGAAAAGMGQRDRRDRPAHLAGARRRHRPASPARTRSPSSTPSRRSCIATPST